MPVSRWIIPICSSILMGLMSAAAVAEQYPTKPVRIIDPNPPGTTGGLMLQSVAEVLSEKLGQPFLVEHRPGGEGLVGMQACANAKPDGHTLCMVSGYQIVVHPMTRLNMPVNPQKDFTFVMLMGYLPAGLFVNQSVPANTLQELLDYAKANPAKLNWASFGRSSSGAIYMGVLRKERGIDITSVPYNSANDALQGLVAGESDIAIYNLKGSLGHVKAGTIRPLAVTSHHRLAALPDMPTVSEAGLATIVGWFTIAAPAGTPKEIVDRLHNVLRTEVFDKPDVLQKTVTGFGFETYAPAGGSPEQLADLIAEETKMYETLLKLADIGKE